MRNKYNICILFNLYGQKPGEEFQATLTYETMENEQVLVCPKCGNSIPVGTLDVDELSF
jgi:hypothetical protein